MKYCCYNVHRACDEDCTAYLDGEPPICMRLNRHIEIEKREDEVGNV